jgi:hypothetical protein
LYLLFYENGSVSSEDVVEWTVRGLENAFVGLVCGGRGSEVHGFNKFQWKYDCNCKYKSVENSNEEVLLSAATIRAQSVSILNYTEVMRMSLYLPGSVLLAGQYVQGALKLPKLDVV